MATIHELIGRNIRDAREVYGDSQEDLGRFLGASKQAIGYWERGKRRVPHEALEKIAQHYAQPISFFFGENNDLSAATAQLQRTERILYDLAQELRALREAIGAHEVSETEPAFLAEVASSSEEKEKA